MRTFELCFSDEGFRLSSLVAFGLMVEDLGFTGLWFRFYV